MPTQKRICVPAVSPHQEYICEGRKRRCFRISRFQFAPFGQLNLANLSAPPSTSTNYCCCGGDSPQIAEARREVNSRTANEGRCGVRLPTAEYEWRIINYMRHSSGPGGTVELNGMVANMNLQTKTTLFIWT